MSWLRLHLKFFVVLALGVASCVTLFLAIRAQHADNGLMRRQCRSGGAYDELHWASDVFPLPVYYDRLAQERYGAASMEVGAFWSAAMRNRRVFTVMRSSDPNSRTSCTEPGYPVDPVVFISTSNADGTLESYEEHNAKPAHIYWDESCTIRCVELKLPGLAPDTLLTSISRHEHGHVLGLDDDIDTKHEESTMHYGGRALYWGADKVTAYDVATLQRVYP